MSICQCKVILADLSEVSSQAHVKGQQLNLRNNVLLSVFWGAGCVHVPCLLYTMHKTMATTSGHDGTAGQQINCYVTERSSQKGPTTLSPGI